MEGAPHGSFCPEFKSQFNISMKALRSKIKNYLVEVLGQDLAVRLYKALIHCFSLFRSIVILFVRYFGTRAYSSGKIALGERRNYKFPLAWIRLDWVNSDFDTNFKSFSRFPFENESMSLIYTAHMLEHIGFENVTKVFEESYRVLKPDGWMRIEVPDASIFVSKYLEDDQDFIEPFKQQHARLIERFNLDESGLVEDHVAVMNALSHHYPKLREEGALLDTHVGIPIYVEKDVFDKKLRDLPLIDLIVWAAQLQTEEQLLSGGHQCGFDFEIIREMLDKAGFSLIKKSCFGNTVIPDLDLNKRSVLNFHSIQEKEHRKHLSLYVDAKK